MIPAVVYYSIACCVTHLCVLNFIDLFVRCELSVISNSINHSPLTIQHSAVQECDATEDAQSINAGLNKIFPAYFLTLKKISVR